LNRLGQSIAFFWNNVNKTDSEFDNYFAFFYTEFMEIGVFIPKDGAYTLFARGKAFESVTLGGVGTRLIFSGTVILYYTYYRHRRAYVVRAPGDAKYFNCIQLPSVDYPVAVLYKACGMRRIDNLRRVTYTLEKYYGLSVYEWDAIFWQKLCCLFDMFDGKRSGSIKSNVYLLSREYLLERGLFERVVEIDAKPFEALTE
jgi:hypothetical protein